MVFSPARQLCSVTITNMCDIKIPKIKNTFILCTLQSDGERDAEFEGKTQTLYNGQKILFWNERNASVALPNSRTTCWRMIEWMENCKRLGDTHSFVVLCCCFLCRSFVDSTRVYMCVCVCRCRLRCAADAIRIHIYMRWIYECM